MPWWTWILLWVALSALSALFVVALGIYLWRGFTAAMREFETAADRLVLPGPLDHNPSDRDPSDRDPSDHGPQPPSGGNGVLMTPAAARRMYHEGKMQRAHARRLRRIRRRAEAGQPQRLRDLHGF